MNKLEEFFIGFVVFPEQLLCNMELTQRESEREYLDTLYNKLVYYSEAIPEHLVRQYEYTPETITAETSDDLSNKRLLETLGSFLEDLLEWAEDQKDTFLIDMTEDILGTVNIVLLNSSLEYLN